MKTIKILYAALIAGATLGTVTSCSDSFLDEKLITEKGTAYFQTKEGIDDLVTGAYQKLKFKYNYIWGIYLYGMGIDEFTSGANNITSYNAYSTDLNSGETAANQPLWDNMYGLVEPANLVIQNTPLYYGEKVSTYNNRLGEGYFLRAFAYFELVKQYGGVPLKLEPSNGKINYTYTRNSEEECFAQIISDFQKAYELLPESPEGKQVGRLTKSAAAHFLAKAHKFIPCSRDLPAMLLEKLTIVKDSGGIGHVRNRIDSVFRNEFQRFINFFICIFDRIQSLIIGNIHQHIRINKIGKVNIASDSNDIRIILTDKSCLQYSHSIVW